jgi:NADH:ubiquinone oxidoreductase subunit E
MKPRCDHNIRVCIGTACYVKGIEKIVHKINEALNIDIGETTENKKFSLEGVRCLGACGLAPVMMIDQETYGALTAPKAISIIAEYDPTVAGALQEEEMAEKEG